VRPSVFEIAHQRCYRQSDDAPPLTDCVLRLKVDTSGEPTLSAVDFLAHLDEHAFVLPIFPRHDGHRARDVSLIALWRRELAGAAPQCRRANGYHVDRVAILLFEHLD
jgi:hypothetical protein